MIAKVFAVALTLTATAGADNCAAANSAYTLKPDAELPTDCQGTVVDECTAAPGKCDCSNCCKVKADTCASEAMGNGTCGSGKEFDMSKSSTEYKSGDKFPDKCCKTKANPTCASQMRMCDNGKAFDMEKKTTEVKDGDAADWKTKCCTDAPKCSADVCTAKAGYKGAKNNSASISCFAKPCQASQCCETDSTKCLGVSKSKQCSNSVMLESKHGMAATAADFQDKCCTAFAKCAAFKSATLKTKKATAGAKQQHAGVPLSLLFAVIGGLVMA